LTSLASLIEAAWEDPNVGSAEKSERGASFFEERIEYAVHHDINRSKLVLDPGIGFGKRLADNIEILKNLQPFKSFGLPILVGASRKSFINMLHPSDKPADKRLGGSLAAMLMAVENGADIVRVHDVEQTIEALKIFRAVRER